MKTQRSISIRSIKLTLGALGAGRCLSGARLPGVLLSVALLSGALFSGCASHQPVPGSEPEPVVRTARLVFIGDVMSHAPQVAAAHIPATDSTSARYDYTDVFAHVRSVFKAGNVDGTHGEFGCTDDNGTVVIANLETTLRSSPPYTGYPAFAAPKELAFAMREAGIDIAVTANNHICDKGARGIRSTLALLDSAGLRHTGAFVDSVDRRARNPLKFTAGGLRFSLLSYTYGTNGLPVPDGFEVNIIDTAVISRDLSLARSEPTDCVIVYYHWGEEYRTRPTVAQRQLAAWTRARGADLIIGGHPHVVGPMEAHYNADSGAVVGATYYSLGNFVSNQRYRGTDGGMMAEITVVRIDSLQRSGSGDSLAVVRSLLCYDLAYRLTWVDMSLRGGKRRYQVLTAACDSIPAARLFFNDTRKRLSGMDKVFEEK